MAGRGDFPGRRWTSIGLRTLHLVGVVLAAVGILGPGPHPTAGIGLILASGIALFALDLWCRPGLWREAAGVFVLAKLLGVAVMAFAPALARPLFWLLVVASAVMSHAPHGFRHHRLLG